MPQQQILTAMQQLAAEGKALTTAAVRARLTTPVPLSELLALVSRYKQDPQSLPPPLANIAASVSTSHRQDEQDNHTHLAARLATLEHTVAEQALRLARLEKLLMATLDGEKRLMANLNTAVKD
ncbi:hypothetical protein [Oceanisphaera sp. IT1-181]|uniref:hypothetical protein n=1 Tax=Oceanisphaera sp. IT1-181 TaxID=3081199 RepID=UPI0029C9FD7A|nr:hypothetical protein [Oceanisphaera sp. IT1-181]